MTKQWGPQQQQALDQVGRWMTNGANQVFLLGGWAGTGKTTLAKHFAESVDGGIVCFAAYTGKAAHVLLKKGCQNVSTLHKLLYQPKEKSKQKLKELEAELAKLRATQPVPMTLINKTQAAIDEEKRNLCRPAFQLNTDSPLKRAKLLIVDEYSMVDQQMGNDILSFGCKVLCLGDPGQLPPVYGKAFWAGKPDFMLTDIHRQAADSPIIKLATIVREGGNLRPGTYGDSRVWGNDADREVIARLVLSHDQLLVGTNATRNSSNMRVRELKNLRGDYPLKGDRLVCLKNNHQIGVLNGQLWDVQQDSRYKTDDDGFVDLMLSNDDGERLECAAHPEYFVGKTPDIYTMRDAESFDYGYALTVHKAQGSEWDSVVLFDEWKRDDRRKWLYTAITRASQKIDIVQM